MKNVIVLIGDGAIGIAIARKAGAGKHILISGCDFLIDGGVTASYWSGDPEPE